VDYMGKRQASSVEHGEVVSTDVPSWPRLPMKLGSTICSRCLRHKSEASQDLRTVISMVYAFRTAMDFCLGEKIQCVTVSHSYLTANTKEKYTIVSRALEKLRLLSASGTTHCSRSIQSSPPLELRLTTCGFILREGPRKTHHGRRIQPRQTGNLHPP
jgi:hypothetical protein